MKAELRSNEAGGDEGKPWTSFRAAISSKIFASGELPSEKHPTPNHLLCRLTAVS